MGPDNRRGLLALCAGALISFALLVGALFSSRGTVDSASAAGAASARVATAPAATVTAGSSAFGTVLFDGAGRALYAITLDRRGPSACAGDFAVAWPPYVVDRPVQAGPGTEQELLGTIRRGDGGLQVTYGGRPLYYYVGDRQPGQILCQGIVEFGGTWLVVSPDGRLVR